MADFKMCSSNGSAFFEIGANVSTKFVGNSTASGLTANSTGIYSPLLVANIVALNVTTIVSGGTTTTMTASSTSYQHITGTSTQTIKLPDLTTIPTGSAYIIDNDSTSNVTITDSAGTTLIVATTGMAGYIYSMSNATATGNWGGYAYLPVGAQWGDAGLSYRGYFAVGNTTTANTFVINSTALSTVFSATFSNTVTISNNITFSSGGRIVDSTGSQGAVGQVLYSNGSGNVYWGAAASGGSGVNTAYQYGFTNTISFYANVNIVGNSTSELVIGNSSVYVIANSTTIAGTGTSANTTITANGFVTTFDTLGNFYPANNLYIANGSTIIANGAPGSNGQVLTSNGTGIYWAAASGGGTGSNNRSVSSNTTVTLTDDFILATGPVTITLLSASTGKKIYIQNAANTGPVTILPNGTDTIGNQANLIIAYRRSSVGLQPNSTDWVKF